MICRHYSGWYLPNFLSTAVTPCAHCFLLCNFTLDLCLESESLEAEPETGLQVQACLFITESSQKKSLRSREGKGQSKGAVSDEAEPWPFDREALWCEMPLEVLCLEARKLGFYSFFLKYLFLFIWPCRVLVVEHGLLSWSMSGLVP